MDLKIEVKEGNKTTTYAANLEPTKKAIDKAAKGIQSWLRDTFTKDTKTTLV